MCNIFLCCGGTLRCHRRWFVCHLPGVEARLSQGLCRPAQFPFQGLAHGLLKASSTQLMQIRMQEAAALPNRYSPRGGSLGIDWLCKVIWHAQLAMHCNDLRFMHRRVKKNFAKTSKGSLCQPYRKGGSVEQRCCAVRTVVHRSMPRKVARHFTMVIAQQISICTSGTSAGRARKPPT